MSKKVQVDLVMEVLIAKHEVKLVGGIHDSGNFEFSGQALLDELFSLNIPTAKFFRYVRDTRG